MTMLYDKVLGRQFFWIIVYIDEYVFKTSTSFARGWLLEQDM